jgi:hypothetical protein
MVTANVCNVENDTVSCDDRNNNQLQAYAQSGGAGMALLKRQVRLLECVAENHQRGSNASPVDSCMWTHGDHTIKCSVLR